MSRWDKRIPMATIAAPLLLFASGAAAQQVPLSDGTYEIAGGSYSIQIVKDGDNIVVVEPNKRSPYARVADGEYKFYNPNTDATYGIRVIDDHTVEAFKYQPGNRPTRLSRVGGPPPPTGKTALETPGATPSDRYGAMAQHYRKLSTDDPANAQSWVFCAAAALKRSQVNPAEADAYGLKAAQSLKIIAVDPARSPCDDAIPAALWARAPGPDDRPAAPPVAVTDPAAAYPVKDEPYDEEAERAKMNAVIAAATRAQVQRESDDFARKQAAYDAAQSQYSAAQDKYRQDQAAYQDGVAKADAAAAAYRKKMEEYQALIASGKFAPAK